VTTSLDAAPPPAPQTSTSELWGHPKGLYVCFFTEMWERFSFYGMKVLLLLYLTKYHLFTDAAGYDLLGAYAGLVYAMPVIGGLVADRYLGMRKSVVLGGILLCCGHLGMAFEGEQARVIDGGVVQDALSIEVFYFSLALIVMGVGFLKPNISTIVGRLYPDGDARQDSGFTLFYMGINVGAFLSALVCGWLGETHGWNWGFGAAGVGMLIGLGVFVSGQRHLQGQAEPRDPPALRRRVLGALNLEAVIHAAVICGVFVVWYLIRRPVAVHWTMHATATALVLGMGWFLWTRCTRQQAQQMLVLTALILFSMVFWALYEQTYGSWILFSDRVMEREAFGIEWTASQLASLGAFFIFVLSPLFAWLWPRLDRAGRNPSTPAKFGLGIVFAGLSFVVLAIGARSPGNSGMVALWWFVAAYFVLEVGELLLSPIGLSAVTSLSVPRVVSLMMGAWFLASAYSEVVAAWLGKLSSVEPGADGGIDVAHALSRYADLFSNLGWIGLGAGVVVLLLTPILRRGMHGVK
jgi:POT family proton-dependent oligopeptide transporter